MHLRRILCLTSHYRHRFDCILYEPPRAAFGGNALAYLCPARQPRLCGSPYAYTLKGYLLGKARRPCRHDRMDLGADSAMRLSVLLMGCGKYVCR